MRVAQTTSRQERANSENFQNSRGRGGNSADFYLGPPLIFFPTKFSSGATPLPPQYPLWATLVIIV